MRSTEASGVGSERFDARTTPRTRLGQWFASVSTVTYAVALTALFAATLFVLSDLIRSNDEFGFRSRLAASAVLDQPLADPAAGVGQRGAVAFGLVLLVTGLSFRRRKPAPVTVAVPQDGYTRILDSIRAEQRDLARRYHEEKLKAEAASQAKTHFLAHISHDIRTPLNHIIGFADLMHHETYGPLGDDRYAIYVDSIRASGERLLGFFASILDLAELEGGRRPLDAATLGVDDLLVGVTRRFSAQAQRARITLALGTPCGAALLGDRFALERMLGNLVDNALRFTAAGGKVAIAAYAASDGVVLEVTDTGAGMSPERLSTLSQPFAFGDATLTKDRQGAGLGLAIARTIAELSGGHLAIDSRQGLGTTVAVSLPLHTAQARIDAAA